MKVTEEEPTQDEFEEEGSGVGALLYVGLLMVAIVVVGTAFSALAHYVSRWLGLSEEGLVIAYVGVSLGVTVVMTGEKMSQDFAVQSAIGRVLVRHEMDNGPESEGRPQAGTKRRKRRK